MMTPRLFFALDIDTADKLAIKQWREQALNLPFKAVVPDNFHITLAFLGTISTTHYPYLLRHAQQLANCCRKNTPLTITVDECGIFKKPGVIYLGCSTPPQIIVDLADNLAESARSLGIFQETRRYCPHITLYRKARNLPVLTTAPAITLTMKSFSLYQSISTATGVCYQAKQRWPL